MNNRFIQVALVHARALLQSQRNHSLAANYLKFMSLLPQKIFTNSFLPAAKKRESEAIGLSKVYAFIIQLDGQDSFDMNRVVRLAMQKWLV